MRHWMIAVAIALAAPPAAADICQAVALRDIPAIEDPSGILKKGEIDPAITHYNVNRRTGRTSYCSHGGYCFPIYVKSGDDLLFALRMTNCNIDTTTAHLGDEEISYELLPDRSVIPAREMRFEDLTERFENMGLGSAWSSNIAGSLMSRPTSRCAALARRALKGDGAALRMLDAEAGRICQWGSPGARE